MFLARRLPDAGRSRIRRRLEAGDATLNGASVTKGDRRVQAGDTVRLREEEAPRPPAAPPVPPSAAGVLPVLYRDEHLVAVDKPSGLLSHPLPDGADPSVPGLLRAQGLVPCGGDDPLRPGLVHRLDRETSGALLVALREEAFRAMQAAFGERRVEKSYLLLAYGAAAWSEFRCDAPIARDPVRRTLRRADPAGRPAETTFRVLGRLGGDFTLVEARPHTGRTHQIRVHLREHGLSILGDRQYGVRHYRGLDIRSVPRAMLHCRRLALAHPASGAPLVVEAPEPADFAALRAALAAAGQGPLRTATSPAPGAGGGPGR